MRQLALAFGLSKERTSRIRAASCDRLRASEADAIERRAGWKWREWKCLLDGEEVIEHEALTNVGAESLSWTGEECR